MTTRQTTWLMTALLLLSAAATFADDEPKPEPTGYTEIELNTLKAAPEEHNHDKVVYEAKFVKYLTTFPEYIEKSGFDTDRDFLLIIGTEMLPVMARKDDELVKTIANLKAGQTVKVFGKVEKFRRDPERNMMPRYYIKLAEIRVVDTPPVGDANGDADREERVRRWKDRRDRK